jgi:CheY-like chemotaxis protein
MASAVLMRASEPFFTTKETGSGTGLGLAMSRGFAEQSGGALQIDSELGSGTRVTLWFPIAQDAMPTVAALLTGSVTSVPAGQARARILLVYDDLLVLKTLAQELEAEGFAVLTATSGADALATMERGKIVDLVVSDQSMLGMDGLALLRELKRQYPQLPSILFTGFVSGAAELAMRDAMNGAYVLLRKPIEVQVLAERIRLILETAA